MRKPSTYFGLLLIDKPVGPSSHELVQWVRWALREKSVGHCGTLDPQASGLMLLLVGKATRLATYLSAEDKSYEAVFSLGQSTDTDDAAGKELESVDVSFAQDLLGYHGDELRSLGEAILRGEKKARPDLAEECLPWVAEHRLAPPGYSALRVQGKRAHELARRGDIPKLQARPMTVFHSELLPEADWPEPPTRIVARRGDNDRDRARTGTSARNMLSGAVANPRNDSSWPAGFEPIVGGRGETVDTSSADARVSLQVGARLRVSKGSYVRSLAREFGRRLGIPAHLGALRRVASGTATIDEPKVLRHLEVQAWGARPDGAPKWRIRAPIQLGMLSAESVREGIGSGEADAEIEDRPEFSREGQARIIAAALQDPWPYLPRPTVEVEVEGLRRAMRRFCQGQKLRANDEDLRALPKVPALTMVDFSAECAVLVRLDRPEDSTARWRPELVLEYATPKT